MEQLQQTIQIISGTVSTETLELDEEEILIKAGKSAASRAIRISRPLNLPIHYIKDGKLIEELPDGSIRIIKDIPRVVSKDQFLTTI
ncbi:hypothetical protein [Arachidicoccus terrestris]|uniref:hypothetical protein n=1 Tax=Arachidicoccus terrestris TaxID=2875539 RepID=UPI001CC701EF|nr:hypothetical protein [Arachidicoccus terrestris]UAY55661.1 hypothetical protein K9M52_01110 [Arachidicoccus terrestris]